MGTVSYGLFANQTLDGGYILSGLTITDSDSDIYIIKISNDGSKEWEKVITLYDNDASSQAVQLSGGNYFISATSNIGWETERLHSYLG
ncbi:MAG: hypothetical protein R3E32_14445 [Chitinophagales bacterium]